MGDNLSNIQGELEMIKEKKIEKNIISSSKLNKMFPDTHEIFKDKKHSYDDEDDKTKIELSIPNFQTVFSKINEGKIPDQLNVFSGGDELRIQAIRQIGYLNFLKSSFGLDILNKNKMKIHLGSRDIYIGNVSTCESNYNALISQQDDIKKLMDVKFTVTDDYNFYMDEFLIGIIDDLYDMHYHSVSFCFVILIIIEPW